MSLIKWNPSHDGKLTESAMRNKLARMGYDIYMYTYAAGTFFPSHTHDVDKIDGVISGQFQIITDDGQYVLGPGDCIEIPRGVRHSARVIGSEPVVSLDAIRNERISP